MDMRIERFASTSLALIAATGLLILQGHDATAQTAKNLKCKGCVSARDMAKNAVSSSRLKNNAVSAAKLRNGAVSESKLGTGAVGTAKLQDGAVTDAKLSNALSAAISSASAFKVFDDNGALIGELAYSRGVISATGTDASSDVLVESGGFVFSLGIDHDTLFGRVEVRFTDDSCTTNPYIFEPEAFNNVVPLAAIGDGDIYIADTSAAVQSFAPGSRLGAGGICLLIILVPNEDGKPALVVTTFDPTSFTPPFSARR